jgi:hypothetical protein
LKVSEIYFTSVSGFRHQFTLTALLIAGTCIYCIPERTYERSFLFYSEGEWYNQTAKCSKQPETPEEEEEWDEVISDLEGYRAPSTTFVWAMCIPMSLGLLFYLTSEFLCMAALKFDKVNIGQESMI